MGMKTSLSAIGNKRHSIMRSESKVSSPEQTIGNLMNKKLYTHSMLVKRNRLIVFRSTNYSNSFWHHQLIRTLSMKIN